MKILKKILLVLLVAFLIAQFFRPEKNTGNIESVNVFLAETNPPENVKVILKENCFDCHSDSTKYPWYNNITPVNYWLADHIKHGKKHFNVSKWENYSIKNKDHKFDELIEEVKEKRMPLLSYTYTHRDANLNEAQIEAIIKWAEQVRLGYTLAPKPQ